MNEIVIDDNRAGLPILSTLTDLIRTGDEIQKIEGIFSGTLSYIFNSFSNFNESTSTSFSFSQIVKMAKEKGYTEPDPRDDLNGLDVARKVVILGRVAGFKLSLETLPIENIVPEELRSLSLDEFMMKLSEYDIQFEHMNKEAADKGEVLRYVGFVSSQGSCVTLKR